MGKPVKIVDFNKNGTLEFKENELRKILCDNRVKDKKVCLLSVAGVFRGGKSLLLDFFLRYLQRGGSEDWLFSEDEKLDGFCWKGGCERVTTGIWVWNKLFTLPFSPEVEIMLMDTQGLFDNETNMKGSATVFSLSTMVSCIQIYNLSKKITAADLDHLHLFTEYGRLVENEVSGTPFQSLVFLVRDWPNEYDYRFGKEGGKRYLTTVLSSRNDAELQAVRDHIKISFENIDCFLMPHPGLAVEKKGFQGQLKDIREEFQTYLRQLVSMVMSSKGLVHKKNNGKDVTCEGLFMIFQTYIDVFKSGELPSPKSLFMASAELNNRETFENCRNSFLEQMENHFGGDRPYVEENELENKYTEIRNHTLTLFRDAKKMNVSSINKNFEDKLTSQMEDEYEKYKKNNSNKKGWITYVWKGVKYAVLGCAAYLAMVFGGPATCVTLFMSLISYFDVIGRWTRRPEATANDPRPISSSPSMMAILRSAVSLVVLIIVVCCVWSYILPIIIITLLIIIFVVMFQRACRVSF